MKIGDLVKDINDNECYIIVGINDGNGEDFKVYRTCDGHIDVRFKEELSLIK